MRDEKELKKLQSNNKGAALVTVVIVIAFICILTTLILYLSVMNYQMKSTDFKTKESFYGAEVAMEELRVCLAEDMAACSEEAYRSVMAQFSALQQPGSPDLSENLRSAEYEKVMWESMKALWTARRANPTGNDPVADPYGWCYAISDALNDNMNGSGYPHRCHVIMDDATGSVLTCGDPACAAPYHVIIQNLGSDQLKLVTDAPDNHYMMLSGIKISYTQDDFSSVIKTDFCMNIPDYDWSVDSAIFNVDPSATTTRTQIHYEKCVVYMNYMKQ